MLDREMLKTVLGAYGPSGREAYVSNVIRGFVEPYCDEVYNDTLGNLVAYKRGRGGSKKSKVMLSAHMDQIGLIVMDIDEKGFLRVSNVGGVDPTVSIAREMVFENGVRGVTHFETEKLKITEAKLKEIFIDIGAGSKEEALRHVDIGDVAVYASNFVDMGNRIASGALDNRLSCAMLVTVLEKLETSHDVYAVFTVQEELGVRGAGAAAYALDPDFCVNMDVTTSGDTPKAARMSTKLGGGAAIKVMDNMVFVPQSVRRFMVDAAKEAGIPYQMEVLQHGGTDTSAIQRTKAGILAGCVSVPVRYVHTPTETADMRDVNSAVLLLLEILKKPELPSI